MARKSGKLYALLPSFVVSLLLTCAASAHDMTELDVASFAKAGTSYVKVNVANTQKDAEIVCALFGADDRLLASTVAYTNNLATEVVVSYAGDDVATATCVLN